ncbi:hypothetical protein [Sphingomonas sp. 8AM]|uniref:hypothetical protein n=1 Tax=Sphingomonas sp. 8AM TaxID=2653170 RepID=UPI0012F0D71A|nr:hypothetical protein [Sphingomonas sp. 8AM]VXC95804.1 conserved exported hypothetical protein [Sphingomonas sp. 8AM]
MRALMLTALLTAAAPALARDRAADVPPVTPAGPARTCLSLATIEQTLVRSDRVIDFRTTGRRLYRVTLPQRCPGLGAERRFAYATSIGQLCAQDLITVLYASGPMQGARCGLAPFQPVTPTR